MDFIDATRNEWRGDFADRELVDGRIALTPDELHALDTAADELWREACAIPLLHRGGHRISSGYDSQVRHWTACSRTVTTHGRRLFVLCNPPNSWLIRAVAFARSILHGVPLRRFFGAGWKRQIESASIVPTVAWQRKRMVAFPHLDSVNAHDVFRGAPGASSRPEFTWVATMTRADKLALVQGIAALLAQLHAAGRTWGEPVPMNVIIDSGRRMTFIDAETRYFGVTPATQKRMDIAALSFHLRNAFVDATAAELDAAVRDGYDS